MKELLIRLLELFQLACWLEITTDNPRCTYYFGPFLTQAEAEVAQYGYVEDLKEEGAMGISVAIKRFKPRDLTIFNELEELGKPIKFLQNIALSNNV